MKIVFERKIRKIGMERLLNIPEEIRDFEIGEKVKITVEEDGIHIGRI